MQDSQHAGPKPASRRRFFLGGASLGAAVTAVSVLPQVVEPQPAVAPSALPPAPEKGGGYSLSEHVKRYYKTASA